MRPRMTLAELGVPTMPTPLPVSGVAEAVDPEGEALDPGLDRAAGRFLDELEWWARAARAEAARSGRP